MNDIKKSIFDARGALGVRAFNSDASAPWSLDATRLTLNLLFHFVRVSVALFL